MNQLEKICFVATVPKVIDSFLRAHIKVLGSNYEVTVICNTHEKYLLEGIDAKIIFLPINRNPEPLKDLKVLLKLVTIFKREKFHIVHTIMPKAGLLGMLAARIVNVPIRIHTFTGQIWLTKKNPSRCFFKILDMLIGIFSSVNLVDSPSQLAFLIDQKVVKSNKAKVIGHGSICGVDLNRFKGNLNTKVKVREELGISLKAKVIIFVGRLAIDKGVLDLAYAFNYLAQALDDVVLILVGAEEDVSFGDIKKICSDSRDRVIYLKHTSKPERVMASGDIFCMPSYREGFGMTIIEAAATGLPSVASDIYGITDAVDDGKTGILFPAGNRDALAASLMKLLNDVILRESMSKNGRVRVEKLFSNHIVTGGLLKTYQELLLQKTLNE